MILRGEFMNEMIIVFYGELTTKGKNLNSFIRCLGRNITDALKDKFPKLKFEIKRDHIYVILNGEDFTKVKDILVRIPGILSVSHVLPCDKDINKIAEICLNMMDESKKTTFKVVTRRVDKTFPMHSDEVNRYVATHILKNRDKVVKVDIHDPELKINIMIREDKVYIYGKKYQGAGGYPVGIQSKALMLLSGGIDSPVACYMMLKRGIKLECIHFAAPPYTSSKVITKLEDIIHKLNFYQKEIKLHIVPFTKLQLEIYKHVPTSYCITILRRMMMRIASIWALKRRCPVVASGESIGQVASQTLESIVSIENCLTKPMIRPLACLDKIEIIDIAKKIDTYDISIRPYEDCCTIFSTKDPTTCPRIDVCEKYESRFNYQELVEECVNNIETRVYSLTDEENIEL